MTWRDELQPAAWRGVPFLVDSHDASGGRRIALHEYPLRDRPYAEDIGRQAREFNLEAYVLGADYMAARGALVAALEAEGPGTLRHPYLGSLQAAVRNYRLAESTREGGVARFSITFVEAGEKVEPKSALDTGAGVRGLADGAITQLGNGFKTGFSADLWPEFVRTAAVAILQSAINAIEAATAALPGLPDAVSDFRADLGAFTASLSTLTGAPADLASKMTGIIASVGGLAERPGIALTTYRALFDHDSDAKPVPRTTPVRIRQADNQAAIHALVQRAVVVEAARTASRLQWDTLDEALATRDELAERLDTQAETAPDPVYRALTDLRVAMIRDITARGADLSRLGTYTPAATRPALVIAHRLYGDASREGEIVARNRIRRPGMVPGGQELSILREG